MGLVDRVAVVHEYGNGKAGVHLQEGTTEIFVTTGFDEFDVMACMRKPEFFHADPQLLRTQRDLVLVDLPFLLVGEIDLVVQTGRDRRDPPLAPLVEKQPRNKTNKTNKTAMTTTLVFLSTPAGTRSYGEPKVSNRPRFRATGSG